MNLIDENDRIEKELKGKRLICEVAFNRSVFDQWRQEMPQNLEAWKYPFVAAAMMVGIGVYEYEQGDYWHAFPWLTKPGEHCKWGDEFERFLTIHESLETFKALQELGHRYISPILAHGGIPQYCLPDFFKLVAHYADCDQPSCDFIEYLRPNPPCLQNIDKPIKRFLLYGGEVAEEFVARVLDLWRSFERGDGGGTYGLPKRVVEAFGDWYSKHAPDLQLGKRRRSRPRAEVRIKPGDLGVYLFLPRCDDHPDVSENSYWTALGRSWAVTSPHEIPLALKDKWSVEIEGNKDEFEGITDTLPIMFFDRDTGKAIHDPNQRRLPEQLLAVYRKTYKANPPPCYSEPLPDWMEYIISVFDLTGYKELCIDELKFDIRRPFFQIAEDPIVQGCRNDKGVPVFYDVPEINWEGEVNITLEREGFSLGSIDIKANDFILLFDEPGEYKFHLRGSFGQNVRKHFVLIPGLSIRLSPPVRWPTKENVSFEVSSSSVEFRSDIGLPPPFMTENSRLYFQALTETREFQLVAEVPSLKWKLVQADIEAGDWTDKLVEISVHDMLQWNYPRLIFEMTNIEDDMKISLYGKHGVISQLPGSRSDIAIQKTWAFDLRTVGHSVIHSGKAEEFDVLINGADGQNLYQGTVLSVRPQWDISEFRAKWEKTSEVHEIRVSWNEQGPLVSGRFLVLFPYWRPWEETFEVIMLSDCDRSSCVWRIPKLKSGRYLIRAVYAPWGCDDWLKAQYKCQKTIDVDIEKWSETFCYEKRGMTRIEDYVECLLAYWSLPKLTKRPPRIPKGVKAGDIRKFLALLDSVNRVEKIIIPNDISGALDLFCSYSKETRDALSKVKIYPDFWNRILPNKDILNLEPSKLDKKFIFEVAVQYDELSAKKTAQMVKNKFKQKNLSPPLISWHRDLPEYKPPVGDVVFLCEKFELFVVEEPRIFDGEYMEKKIRRNKYIDMKNRHQNRGPDD